jgi:hypothetical protein
MQRVDNPEQDISTTWRKFSEVWAVASRNSLYRILAISVALGARQRAKSSSQAPLYVLGWGGEGGDCYCELPRILLLRSTPPITGRLSVKEQELLLIYRSATTCPKGRHIGPFRIDDYQKGMEAGAGAEVLGARDC